MNTLVCLLLVAAAVQPVLSAVFRAPLIRKETLQERLLREERYPEFRANNRELVKKFASNKAKRLDHGSTPFYDYGNAEYNVQIGLGQPPQLFQFLPDTGNPDVWVVDSTCDPDRSYYDCPIYCQESPFLCSNFCEDFCCSSVTPTPPAASPRRLFEYGDPCANKQHFDSSASSSYATNAVAFNASSILGDVSGFVGRDTLAIGGFELPAVTFGQADRLSVSFTGLPWDGVLGLGFGPSDFGGAPSLVQQAADSGLFDAPVFAVWLPTAAGFPQDQPAGALTLGGLDVEHCAADTTYAPLTSDHIYTFEVAGSGTNGKRDAGSYKAIVALGAAQIIVPLGALIDLTETTNAQWDWDLGLYYVDCSLQFTWSVWLDERTELRADQSTLTVAAPNGNCYLNFVYFDEVLSDVEDADFVLGTPFLRQFCTVYDVGAKQLGFSKPLPAPPTTTANSSLHRFAGRL